MACVYIFKCCVLAILRIVYLTDTRMILRMRKKLQNGGPRLREDGIIVLYIVYSTLIGLYAKYGTLGHKTRVRYFAYRPISVLYIY